MENSSYSQILIEPALNGATTLVIVTGYSNPQMILRHMDELNSLDLSVDIDLLVGMTGVDGMSLTTLSAFQSIPSTRGRVNLNCRFTVDNHSVHSKVYLWKDAGSELLAWVGSANYTQNGFGLNHRSHTHHEFMTQIEPRIASGYINALHVPTVDYGDQEIKSRLRLYERELQPKRRYIIRAETEFEPQIQIENESSSSVLLPLVMTRGEQAGQVHTRAGLNWGQREGRNPSQAYIPVPQSIASTGFFPERGYYFQLSTDDGQAFIATVAQDGNKAIETPSDNSLLGKYFRSRLGVPEDSFVSIEDLQKYGSTAVRISKLSDDEYQLDFAPGINYPR